MEKASTAVFDVGKVLIDFDQRNLYRTVFPDPVRMEWFLAEVCSPDWTLELDRGRPFADAIAERINRYPELTEEIRLYDLRWMDILIGPIEGSVELLQRLHRNNVDLFCITNFPADKFEKAKAIFPFLDLFKGAIVSGREKLVKPDEAIFRLLLDRYGLSARGCLFIDDVKANVEAARKVGMHGHHFQNPCMLARELKRHEFPL